eukprot:358772-Chlamydomonas_euryale.AAC.15
MQPQALLCCSYSHSLKTTARGVRLGRVAAAAIATDVAAATEAVATATALDLELGDARRELCGIIDEGAFVGRWTGLQTRSGRSQGSKRLIAAALNDTCWLPNPMQLMVARSGKLTGYQAVDGGQAGQLR